MTEQLLKLIAAVAISMGISFPVWISYDMPTRGFVITGLFALYGMIAIIIKLRKDIREHGKS